jgi:hypothetical protein
LVFAGSCLLFCVAGSCLLFCDCGVAVVLFTWVVSWWLITGLGQRTRALYPFSERGVSPSSLLFFSFSIQWFEPSWVLIRARWCFVQVHLFVHSGCVHIVFYTGLCCTILSYFIQLQLTRSHKASVVGFGLAFATQSIGIPAGCQLCWQVD